MSSMARGRLVGSIVTLLVLVPAAPAALAVAYTIDSTTRSVWSVYANLGDPSLNRDNGATETYPGAADEGSSVDTVTRIPVDLLMDPNHPGKEGLAKAGAWRDGRTTVEAGGIITGSPSGSQIINSIVTERLTVTTPAPPGISYTVYYSFDLHDMVMEFWGGWDAFPSQTIQIGYSVGLEDADGTLMSSYDLSIDGTPIGADVSVSIFKNIPGDMGWSTSWDPGHAHAVVDLDPISARDLALGTVFEPTFTISTRLYVIMTLFESLDQGAYAYAADPNGLTVDPYQRVRLTPLDRTVPESATLALLGIGLAGIGWRRHRATRSAAVSR